MTEPRTKAGNLRARLGEYLERQQNTPWSEGYSEDFRRGYDTAIEEVDAIASVVEAEASAVPEGLPLPIMPEDLGRIIADRLYTTGLIERDDRDDAQAIVRAALAATPAKAEGYTGEGTLIANPDGTATLAPAKAEGLDLQRLARALFAAMGWPTRWTALGIEPLPSGIVSGDPDNPEWRALAATVASEYADPSDPAHLVGAARLADTATEGEDR